MLTSKRNGTLYIGVTSDLLLRIEQHRRDVGSAFVKRYGVNRLVWLKSIRFMLTQSGAKQVLSDGRELGNSTNRETQSQLERFTGKLEFVILDGRVKPAHGEKKGGKV